MSVDVKAQVVVRRPRADIAAFMFDPRNDMIWTTGIVASRPLTNGPLRVGSRVERVSRFLGRSFGYQYEVVGLDEDRSVELRVEQPFPMQIRYELEDSTGGTAVAIRARGDAGRFRRPSARLHGAAKHQQGSQQAQTAPRVDAAGLTAFPSRAEDDSREPSE